MPAREWDRTVLTVKWWDGKAPRPGDGLETGTGRRYLIFAVKRKRDGALRALECVVLPKGEPVEGRIFEWVWAPRRKRAS